MKFDKFVNMKYKYVNRHFWCKGYYASTIGRNEKKIAEYIQNQLQEDMAGEQLSMKEYIDPFSDDEEETKKKKKGLLK